MTEVKFNAKNWFEDYNWRLNDGPLRNQLSAIYGDLIEEIIVETDGTVAVVLQSNVDTRTTAKIDNEELNLHVKFYIRYAARYEVETSLNSEDAAEAERNLQAAIKSGETEFKVPTTLVKKDIINHVFGPWIYASDDDENLVDHMKFSELLENAIDGKAADLGDFEFLKDYIPTLTPKDERIEFICEIPEESTASGKLTNLTKQEFHIDDWLNYYNAKIDERYLGDYIDDCYEGYPDAKIEMSGDTITTHVESGFSYCIGMIFEDAETGEEIETESDVTADFAYTVIYKVDNDLDDFIEDIEESLNNALNNEESTFEIIVPISVVEVKNVEVTYVENHHLDDDFVARISGGESAIVREIQSNIERDLSEATDARHNGDFIQPPIDKEVRFICTTPTK